MRSRGFQTIQAFWRRWRSVAIGLVLGLGYGIISQQLDFEAAHAPKVFIWLSDLISVILEGVLGAGAGLAFDYIRRQQHMNRALSTENVKLQRHLLTQTLSAHILHEIRNPLHNLTAVIEDLESRLSPEETSVLTHNLSRLKTMANQLSRWTASDDELDLRESILLGPWLNEFLFERVRPRLRGENIPFEQSVESVVVQIHSLLLEQALVPLFNNAIEATIRGDGARAINLMVLCSPKRHGYVEIQLRNTGELYPDAVLAMQGKEPIKSQHGLGLGLMLARRSMELAGGSLELTNKDAQATTTLWIPGHAT